MSGSNWVRPVVLAVSCLVIGFVGGWSLANIGGDTVELPDAKVDVTVETPNPQTSTASTETATGPAAPARDQVAVAVLNGTTVQGQAARTADQLKKLGYTKVETGNAGNRTGTVVYYRAEAKAAAEQLAGDLQAQTVSPIDGTDFAKGTPDAQVVLVLGS